MPRYARVILQLRIKIKIYNNQRSQLFIIDTSDIVNTTDFSYFLKYISNVL